MTEVRRATVNGRGASPRGPAGRGGGRRWLLAALVVPVLVAAVVKMDPGAIGEGLPAAADASGRAMVRVQPPPQKPRKPLPRDALAGMPPDLLRALTAAETQGGQPFRFLVAVPPPAICAAMAGQGLFDSQWAAVGDDWECASDLVPVPGSVRADPDPSPELLVDGTVAEPTPSTLFFIARGPSEDRIGIIRFKLNLDDPSTAKAGRAALLAALDRLSGPLAWSIPAAVEDAILHHRKLSVFDRGIAVEIHPETDPVERLNVVLLLETPSARLPSDRFEALPPGVAERLAR